MPTIGENTEFWRSWDWSQRGDEWSAAWGGTPALWYGALLPRLHALLPARTILEIAPGYGRWTQYLTDLCEQLTIVDLVEACIAHCRERFADASNITYHVNDGRSLAMVEDESVEFAFSFDSLVHADPGVIGAYLEQLTGKLAPDGVGFIHHSNAGGLRRSLRLARRVPDRLFDPLVQRGVIANAAAWRDEHMSAEVFRQQCHASGLSCIGQELISWGFGRYLLDCFSLFTRPGSSWDRPVRVTRNPTFVAEARRTARLYAASSFRGEAIVGRSPADRISP